MFVPAFRTEVPFSRFDSAVTDWYAGRRISTGRAKVIDTQSLSGHASTWVVFESEYDYMYVYQNWLQTDRGWELVWISSILDNSFQYGRSDTVGLTAVSRATLAHLVEDGGLARVRPDLLPPDTVLVVRREAGTITLDSKPVIMRSPEQMRIDSLVPRVPYCFQFALTRIYGRLAFCVVDLKRVCKDLPCPVSRRRSIQVFLEMKDGAWRFHSFGKVW
jgi:hypothetical protein